MSSVGLHSRVLGNMVEIVGLHCGEYLVMGYMVVVLSYMVESIGLHGVLDYMVGCRIIWWGLLGCIVESIRLHVWVLGYMVGCWVIWWSVVLHGWCGFFRSIMEIVGLYGGKCWITLWGYWAIWCGVGVHAGGVGICGCVFSNMVESVGLHGGVLGYILESVDLHGGECWVIW